MKLKRFNENSETIIDGYSPSYWNKDKVINHLNKKDIIEGEDYKLRQVVQEYLSLNPHLLPIRLQNSLKKWDDVEYYVTDLIYYPNNLFATVSWKDGDETEETEDIIGFFDFLENYDLYKDVKKYNL